MTTKKEIREWLKQQGYNEEWFSKQLNCTEVDKWFMSNEENPRKEWEDLIDQIMNPREMNLFLYQSWNITKKILEEWKLKSTNLANTNDPKEAVPQGMEDIWNNEELSHRVLCFSTVCTSSDMWKCYADEHQGVCLVFRCKVVLRCEDELRYWQIVDCSKDDSHFMRRLYRVHYNDFGVYCNVTYGCGKEGSLSKEPICGGISPNKFVELFITKEERWSYENEFRMILPVEKATWKDENYNLYYAHMMKYLVGLILGVNFSRSDDAERWYSCLKDSETTKKRQELKIVYAKKDLHGNIVNSEWNDREFNIVDIIPKYI